MNFNLPNVNASSLTAGREKSMPATMSWVFAMVAVVAALIFDVIFMMLPIGGLGYLWYLSTAICFGGAGYGAIRITKASRNGAIAAIVVASLIYGVGDMLLEKVVEGVDFSFILRNALIGVVIALVTGIGGVTKGNKSE